MEENIIELINSNYDITINQEEYTITTDSILSTDYKYIQNKPQINNTELFGNLELQTLNIASLDDIKNNENIGNKTDILNENSTNVQYPSAKCIYEKLNAKADTSLNNLDNIGQSKFDIKVNKAGDTMTGNLIIDTSSTTPVVGVKKEKTIEEIPSSTYNYGYFGVYDGNDTSLGGVAVMQQSTGNVEVMLRSTYGSTKRISIYSDGSTYAPASANINSIITTTGISKASNGYIKLGNGIITQWGTCSVPANATSVSVTLPTSFSSDQYGVTAIHQGSGAGQTLGLVQVNNITASSFTLNHMSEYTNTLIRRWIAIGY